MQPACYSFPVQIVFCICTAVKSGRHCRLTDIPVQSSPLRVLFSHVRRV